MGYKDVASNVIAAEVLASAVVAAQTDSSGTDAKEACKRGVQLNITAQTALDDTNYFNLVMQESDDDVTYNDAPGVPAEDAKALGRYALSYAGVKRYFRLRVDIVGAPSATMEASSMIVPEILPAAQ